MSFRRNVKMLALQFINKKDRMEHYLIYLDIRIVDNIHQPQLNNNNKKNIAKKIVQCRLKWFGHVAHARWKY